MGRRSEDQLIRRPDICSILLRRIKGVDYLEVRSLRISEALSQFSTFLLSLSIVRAASCILSRFLVLPEIRNFVFQIS